MCSTWKQWLFLSFGLMSAWGAWAQPACEHYELLMPKRGSQIADRQPELHWNGDANSNYRIQLAVLLPEGRVLESVDTVVTGTKWRLGAPVSVLTSVFKVIVSRNCPTLSIQDLNAQGPYFIVQAADQCALKAQSFRQRGNVLEWAAVSNADRFEVQLFALTKADDGTVTTRRTATYEPVGATWKLSDEFNAEMKRDVGAGRSWTATVQARCGALLSQPQAVRVSAWP